MPFNSISEEGYDYYEVPFPVNLAVLQDKNATVAQVTYTGAGVYLKATGSSKREPGDRYNPAIGEKLAVSRAMVKMGRQLAQLASKEVKQVSR